MPEEEIEYLEDSDNKNNDKKNNTSSLKSSLKDTTNNIIDFNKYKSRKNTSDKSNTNKSSNTLNNNTIRNRALNGIKNQAFNKMANAHPALKALSVLNGAKNMIGRSHNPINSGGIISNNSSSDGHGIATSDIDNETDKSTEDTSVINDTNENATGSSGLFGSSFGGTSGFLGKFSFMGKLSLPMKLGIIGSFVFLGFFLLILVITIPVGIFSGFFGMDGIETSNGSSSNIDYGDYELTSDGDEILHQSLDSFLESKGTSLEEFNNLLASNVENSGYGTGAGVVATAVTLIAELGNNYDVKIPYFWGGGHGQMISGADGSWGSNSCRASANGRIYDYCGLDCSGFVAWAIYNGGFNIAARIAGDFQSLPGAERVSLTNSAVLQPGDLIESNAHIVLVVGVDEDAGEYICAEASGYTTGVLFTRRPFNQSGYWGVKMAGFYERQVRS